MPQQAAIDERDDVRLALRAPAFKDWMQMKKARRLLLQIVNLILWCFTEQRCGVYVDGAAVKKCMGRSCCGSALHKDA